MAYATEQDLLDRFNEDEVYVTFDRNNLGELDQAALDKALADADEEINSYLTGRYELPLVTVPPLLTRLAASIAMYHGSTGTVMTEEKEKRYDGAVKMLEKIASGKTSLGLASSDEPDSREQMKVVSSTKLFSDEELNTF